MSGRPKRAAAASPHRLGVDFVSGDELDGEAGSPECPKRRRRSSGGGRVSGAAAPSTGLLGLLASSMEALAAQKTGWDVASQPSSSPAGHPFACSPPAGSPAEPCDGDIPSSMPDNQATNTPPEQQAANSSLNEEFNMAERMVLATGNDAKLGGGTLKNYHIHFKKLKAWQDLTGYDLDKCLSAEALAHTLGRWLMWVADGQPGFDYTGKKSEPALRPPPNLQDSVQLNMQLQAAMARVMTTGQGHKELQDSTANIEQDLAMMATVRQDQNQADSSESGAAAASTACSAPPPPPPLGAQQQEVQLQAAAQLSFAASAQEAAAALAACTQQLAGAGTNDALKSLIDSMARCMAVAAAMMAGAAVHTRLVPPAGSLGAATEGVLAPMGSGEGGGVGGSSSGGGDGGSGYGGSGNGTSSAATQAVPCNLPMQLGKVSSVVKLMELYYRGDGVFPAWRQREAESAVHDGLTWRSGGRNRRMWNSVKNVVALVTEMAAADAGVSLKDNPTWEPQWEQAKAIASEWDCALGSMRTGAGPAKLSKVNNHPGLRELFKKMREARADGGAGQPPAAAAAVADNSGGSGCC